MTFLADATAYIDEAFGPTYTAWLALSTDDQTKTLTSAQRYLDLLSWQGTATGVVLDGGLKSWPRSGITIDGVAVDSATVPADVTSAQFEMAVLIAASPAVVTKPDQGSNIQSVGGAGVPTVAFFAPTSAAAGTATRLPFMIQELVGKYLAVAGPGAEGDSGVGIACSSFRRSAGFPVDMGS